MGETIPKFPLQWPVGWKRTRPGSRTRSKFQSDRSRLTIAAGVQRVRDELGRMGVREAHVVISSDLLLRLDGLPRSAQPEPNDPGVAVYWRTGSETRCMAIDRYDRVADNLAAIAATLDAMRSIERHGGAAILDRAFTGFSALPPPAAAHEWHAVLGVQAHTPTAEVREAYRRLRSAAHPDKPDGNGERFDAITCAWGAFCRERGIDQ